MKQIIAIFLLCFLLVGFSACMAKEPAVNQENSSSSSTTKPSASEPATEPDDGIPAFVQELYEAYGSITTAHSMKFWTSQAPEYQLVYKKTTFAFAHSYGKETSVDRIIEFTEVPGTQAYSFRVSLHQDRDPVFAKDLLTATLMALDDTLTYSTARQKAAGVLNAYKYEDYSPSVTCGGYKLYFTPAQNEAYSLEAEYLIS